MDAETTAHIGAGMHEENETRTTQRNGTRTKVVSTTSGDLGVKAARTRIGSFFPTLLCPRRRCGAACGRDGGLRARGVGPEGRRPGGRAGRRDRDLQVGGNAICAELDEDVAALTSRDLCVQGSPTSSSTPPTVKPGSVAPRPGTGHG